MKYAEAKALAWLIAAPEMKPTAITRFAGGRYNSHNSFAVALAKVCNARGVEYGPGQPTGDTTDYVRQPTCWFFEDRTVPCAMSTCTIIMP